MWITRINGLLFLNSYYQRYLSLYYIEIKIVELSEPLVGWTGSKYSNNGTCGGSNGVQNILGYIEKTIGNDLLKKVFSNLRFHKTVRLRIQLIYK